MTETIDQSEIQNKPGKVPSFLMVLLILTSLNVGYNLVNSMIGIGTEADLESVQAELMESLEESGTNIEDLPAPILSAFEDFFPKLLENAVSYGWYQIVFYILMIVPIFLMYKLRKQGFYIYAVLQIIGALDVILFFGANWITISIAIGMGLWAGIWILLYWLNTKYMH